MHTTPKPATKTELETDLTPDAAMAHIKAVRRVKRIEVELTMLIAQTKALETLMHCMTPVQPTGDARLDAAHARERNRQRLAATQTLLHIRTVQREQRLRRTMREKAKAKAERAAKGTGGGATVGAKGEGHGDNGSPVAPSPLRGRRWSCADSAQDRMRGRPGPPEDQQPPSPSGVVSSEADGHVDNGPKPSTPNALRAIEDRRQITPPPPPHPAPPMLPPDARYQELKLLRAEKMAKRGAQSTAATRCPRLA